MESRRLRVAALGGRPSMPLFGSSGCEKCDDSSDDTSDSSVSAPPQQQVPTVRRSTMVGVRSRGRDDVSSAEAIGRSASSSRPTRTQGMRAGCRLGCLRAPSTCAMGIKTTTQPWSPLK